MSNSTCILFSFTLVCLISSATASRSSLSDTNILSCEPLLGHMTHCLNYLGKLSGYDHPSSSCCSMVRDAWKVDPECVNFNVLDGFILQYYDGFDRNTTRVDHMSSTCGIGSLTTNSPSPSRQPASPTRPPVAASPSPVQPTEGSSQNNDDLFIWSFLFFYVMWVASTCY